MSVNSDTAYVCQSCGWVQETKTRATACHRCLARSVKSLSSEELVDGLEVGDVEWCEPCGFVHTAGHSPIRQPRYRGV